MWWADIEVPNHAVAMDAWAWSACYPQSTFYPMSNGDTTFHRWITRSCFRNCSTRRSYSKAHLYPYALRTMADRAECTFELLRYFLGGNRPSQTDSLKLSHARLYGVMVRHPDLQGWYFTWWLLEPWRAQFNASHLCYTCKPECQYQITVKVHGVFPSCCGYPAFSPELQFHRDPRWDSAQIITRFVQVGTYPTRNFATLGPL